VGDHKEAQKLIIEYNDNTSKTFVLETAESTPKAGGGRRRR
jgi:hypothetical protein